MRLTSRTRSTSSSSSTAIGLRTLMPGVHTRPSRAAVSFVAVILNRSIRAGPRRPSRVGEVESATRRPPARRKAPRSRRRASAAQAATSRQTTRAPCAAHSNAVAAPIPDPAPITATSSRRVGTGSSRPRVVVSGAPATRSGSSWSMTPGSLPHHAAHAEDAAGGPRHRLGPRPALRWRSAEIESSLTAPRKRAHVVFPGVEELGVGLAVEPALNSSMRRAARPTPDLPAASSRASRSRGCTLPSTQATSSSGTSGARRGCPASRPRAYQLVEQRRVLDARY